MRTLSLAVVLAILIGSCLLSYEIRTVKAFPHYTTEYWSNGCENLSDFTINEFPPDFYVTLNNTSHKEAFYSILCEQTSAEELTGGITVTNYTIGDTIPIWNGFPYLFYGAWIKVDLNYSSANIIYWQGNNSYAFGFRINGVTGEFRGFLLESHGFVYTPDLGVVNDGEWHWFEVWVMDATVTLPSKFYQYFIDGNPLDSFIGDYDLFFPQTFISSFDGGLPITWRTDFLRVSNGEEYPAGGGAFSTLDMTSTPYNATFVYLGTSYSYPQTLAVTSGSISITTEYGRQNPFGLLNETMVNYVFSSWTVDGVQDYSTSRTLDLTVSSPMTVEAVYVQARRLSIEGGVFNFGIGLFGLILMFLSWFVAYFIHKHGDTLKGVLIWLVMFVIGYGLFTVILGG